MKFERGRIPADFHRTRRTGGDRCKPRKAFELKRCLNAIVSKIGVDLTTLRRADIFDSFRERAPLTRDPGIIVYFTMNTVYGPPHINANTIVEIAESYLNISARGKITRESNIPISDVRLFCRFRFIVRRSRGKIVYSCVYVCLRNVRFAICGYL